MTSRRFLLSLICIVAFAAAKPTGAQEWCRFRGPNGSGRNGATSIPATWTADDYNWRVALPGIGHSSPVVWGDSILITSGVEKEGTWIVLCLKTSDGSIIWQKSFPATTYKKNPLSSYASSTPAVDKDRVYTTWATPAAYIVLALDRRTGDEVWRRDLGPFVAQHGFGASPLLYGDSLIVPNDQDGPSFVIALDRATGETRWKTDRLSKQAAYSTPIIYQPSAGPSQLILTGGAHGISSYNPETGKKNWQLDVLKDRVVGSPIVAADLLIAGCGAGAGGKQVVAARPGQPEKNIEPEVVYEFKGSLPYVPVPVACGPLVFLWSDTGVVTCADAQTGKVHWRERLGGKFYGSPICVGDRLYCMSCTGEMVVLAAADQYKLLGRMKLDELGYSTPAVADGAMYLRTFSHLISIGGPVR